MNEQKAREILGDLVQEDNSIYDFDAYINWVPGTRLTIDNTGELDSNFLNLTPDLLRALAWWIENFND